jgi:hypothetical protein
MTRGWTVPILAALAAATAFPALAAPPAGDPARREALWRALRPLPRPGRQPGLGPRHRGVYGRRVAACRASATARPWRRATSPGAPKPSTPGWPIPSVSRPGPRWAPGRLGPGPRRPDRLSARPSLILAESPLSGRAYASCAPAAILKNRTGDGTQDTTPRRPGRPAGRGGAGGAAVPRRRLVGTAGPLRPRLSGGGFLLLPQRLRPGPRLRAARDRLAGLSVDPRRADLAAAGAVDPDRRGPDLAPQPALLAQPGARPAADPAPGPSGRMDLPHPVPVQPAGLVAVPGGDRQRPVVPAAAGAGPG